MALDPYQPCPCGIDKKVKFCCGSEIVGDLGKIEDAIAGEQRMQALDQINRLLAVKADRPCLHMYKAMVHIGLQEIEPARQAVEKMLELAPENPSGLALDAMLDCFTGAPLDAVPVLQHALEIEKGKINQTVYECIGTVGRALAGSGELLAARGHLIFQVAASQSRDQNALSALLELDGSGQVPLVVQGMVDLALVDSTSTLPAASVAEFNAALREAQLGCWQLGAQKFTELAQKEPNEPAIWKNIGILLSFIAENDAAAYAFRRYSSLAAVPRDDAVEAEAVAQFLNPLAESDTVPEVTVTYTINDAQALQETLISNKRLQNVPFDPAAFRENDEVPPQSVYLLLDRELPTNIEALNRDNVPKVLGEIMLYGKQTDRAARIEFSSLKTADFDAKIEQLLAVLGQFAGTRQSEEITGHVPAVAAALTINWRFPDGTPADVRSRLLQEQRADALLNRWPEIALSTFDGKTARQAAAEPELQIRVLAAILLMDLASSEENPVFNELRRSLGLPTVEPIDPSGIRIASLSPARLARLDVTKLSDEDLLIAYQRGILISAARLLRKVGPELVSRPGMEKKVDKADVYELLSRMAADSDEALQMLIKAQEAAKAKGKSPARHLLAEIPLRIQRMEQQEFIRLVDVLRTKHINEPGIAQALYSLLAQLGLVQPGAGGPGGPRMPSGMGGAPAVSAGAGASPLWTPEQSAPAAPAGKSKLWIPGMD